MADFFDDRETRSPAQREAEHMTALPLQIAHAQRHTAAFSEILQGIDATRITSRAALQTLPITRKSQLQARQKEVREAFASHGDSRALDVFGGFSSVLRGTPRSSRIGRIFASPGPIFEPEARADQTTDYWRAGRAVFAAGFRAGDLAHNAFSYHMTPGAYLMESGAHAVGCTVFPAGTGQTEQQLQAMEHLQPDGYLGTPSFLKILVDKALDTGQKLSLKKGLVSGEAFAPSLRDWFTDRGMNVYQCFATADVGLIAYETTAREGLILDEGVIVEIVRPGTSEPVAEGEVGELVVTVLNPLYPLIRFGTGDLTAVLPGQCPTGRSNTRIRGWLGRADESAKIRGMFVHPAQVSDVVKRFPQVKRARLVISGEMADDRMLLKVETEHSSSELQEKLAWTAREVTKLRCDVELLPVGSLPNDGKVIEDTRSHR